jgi:hypothetical protein
MWAGLARPDKLHIVMVGHRPSRLLTTSLLWYQMPSMIVWALRKCMDELRVMLPWRLHARNERLKFQTGLPFFVQSCVSAAFVSAVSLCVHFLAFYRILRADPLCCVSYLNKVRGLSVYRVQGRFRLAVFKSGRR